MIETPISSEELIAIQVLVQQPNPIQLHVNNYNQPVKTGEKGDKGDRGDKGDKGEKGDKGDTGNAGADGSNQIQELILQATTEGQTSFNVFGNPAVHSLIVRGVEYKTYSISQVSGNWRLNWSGPFALSPDDEIIFRQYKS